MTGIFQIFDRYKSKSYAKNDPRKTKTGESESKAVPTYYLIDEDGVAKKAPPDASDRQSSRSEASRDSRRPSSADNSEVVVKALTSPKESQAGSAQKPQSARPSIDSQIPNLSIHKSWSPREPQREASGFKDSSKIPEYYLAEAVTPKLTVPPRRSSVGKDGLKLPPRDTRNHASKSSANKDRSRTPVENAREAPAHVDDARDISRAVLQMKEVAQSPFEAHRYSSSSAARKDLQRYLSSGDEREEEKHRRDGRRYQSSGDEKDAGHRHRPASGGDSREAARRYSSVSETYGEQKLYDDERDHHRPQFPSEGKDFLRSWHSTEARRNQVKEMQRYVSSGDEMDARRYMSSGDEKGGPHRVHPQSRHRAAADHESSRSYWPLDGQRHEPAGDAYDGLRYESSGDERVSRPYSSAGRKVGRRHHYYTSGDERGHKHYSSRERGGEGRRPHQESQGLQSSGDERGGQRYIPTKETHRRHSSSAYYGGHKHQPAVELSERHHASSARDSRHQPSTSGFEGRHYQSSGDERGGHRWVYPSAGGREGGKSHDTPLDTHNRWRNESSDDDRESFTQQTRSNARDDGRRYSSATDVQRRHSLGNDDGRRYNSSTDEKHRDRSRSGYRYEPANRSNDWTPEETNHVVLPSLVIPAALKEAHRRSSSVESRGGHRRRGSTNSSSVSKEPVKPHLSVDIKEKEFSTGYSRDLPPRSSSRNTVISPRNLVDIRDLARLTVQVRESSQASALREKPTLVPESSSHLSSESVTASYDFREMLRAMDSQWNCEKVRDVSSRNSIDGRDPPRTSNVSRVSVDSRQYQSSTPRLSVEGREHLRGSSLHSSRASSVDAQVQLRSNSMDSSGGSGEFKRRGPSVVARLMGLAELPDKDTALPSSDRPQVIRDGKSLQKLLSTTPPAEAAGSPPSDRGKAQIHLSEVAQQMKQVAARLHQDSQARQKSVQGQQETVRPKRKSKAKSRPHSHSHSHSHSRSRSPPPAPAQPQDTMDHTRGLKQHNHGTFGRQSEPGSPLPKQPMSPKHHQMEGMPNVFKRRPNELSPGDLDQRLHQLRIRNSIQEHRTLKQILEAMHLKGLLHPPQKKLLPKSPRAEYNNEERAFSKEQAERPLYADFGAKSPSSLARAHRMDYYQEHLTFEDLLRADSQMQEDPALEIDHSGEASIVVMKPVCHHSVIPLVATKEVDFNSEAAALSGLEKEQIEFDHRGRGSERRGSTSGKASRAQSLEPPEQRFADKPQDEDLSFANVMLSWRERIAADAAKKATVVELAEDKTQPRFKSSSAVKFRATRNAGSAEKRVGSPRVEESLEEYFLNNREESDGVSRSDTAQDNADHDEDIFKLVGRSKSDLQLSSSSAETVAAAAADLETSLDRVPAQVAVLRSKRTPGKTSRSKDKLRAPHPGDLHIKPPQASLLRTLSNLEPGITPLAEPQLAQDSNDSKVESPGTSSSLKAAAEDNSRVMPKKRKLAEPDIVHVEEEKPQLPALTCTLEEVEVVQQDLSNEEADSASAHVEEISHFPPVADIELAQEPEEDAKMEDAFDDEARTPEARTPEGFPSGKDKCFREDGAFALQGADYPSPVSVFDSPIFQEGFHSEELSTSPASVKSTTTATHQDADEHEAEALTPRAKDDGAAPAPACEHEAEVVTPCSRASKELTSDPLRDIYTKVARSLELGEKEIYRGQELQIPAAAAAVVVSDDSEERRYVQEILAESGLTDPGTALSSDAAEIMQFEVFTRKEEELQTAELDRIDRGELDKSEEKRYKESLDRRLVFDCMNEVLERKLGPFVNPQPWGAPVLRRRPSGQRLVDEVWDELQDMHWPTSAAYDALYAVLQKDFMRKGFQWLNFCVEVGEVGCDLAGSLLQDLVDDVAHDLTSLQSKSVKKQPPSSPPSLPSPPSLSPPPSPEAPSEVSSDDSERRRRELLDKTRRDLLAWHVQYQQL